MDRSPPDQLTPALRRLRADALAIAAAGVDAVSPRVLVPPAVHALAALAPSDISVIAAGKAAVGMYEAFTAASLSPIREAVVAAPSRPASWPHPAAFVEGGHPFATAGSVAAGEAALALAARVPATGALVCLLSGGASAIMAMPIEGLALEAKQHAVSHVMTGGADITALNAVRKHLSRVKGGRLAAACPGAAVTLAISDVIGDDLSVIGSGPCVPDASTWRQAADAVNEFGGWEGLDGAVRRLIEAGLRGNVAETPKPGDPRMARTSARVIGGRREAMAGAAHAARVRGYTTVVVEAPVAGEARDAAIHWWASVQALAGPRRGPVAVISSGETTVRVRGRGRGGRNQEFALALADTLAGSAHPAAVVSLGTDGIDGPTDAAGAVVDPATRARALAVGRDAQAALAANDAYSYFDAIGDLVRPGPSGTNVGDLQVLALDVA
ncbi:MAG: glycerate kinase [Vicinamibacterales bacterium]